MQRREPVEGGVVLAPEDLQPLFEGSCQLLDRLFGWADGAASKCLAITGQVEIRQTQRRGLDSNEVETELIKDCEACLLKFLDWL